jgi:hypothetical protein
MVGNYRFTAVTAIFAGAYCIHPLRLQSKASSISVTWEEISYSEFDGRRKKRVLVKILGERSEFTNSQIVLRLILRIKLRVIAFNPIRK